MDGTMASLAAPDGQRTSTTLKVLAVDSFAALVTTVFNRDAECCDRSGTGVFEALEAVTIHAAQDFETAWSPGAGYLAEGVRERDPFHVQVGVLLTLLHGAARGVRVEWSLQLPREVSAHVRHVRLRHASFFRVCSDAETITLTYVGAGHSSKVELWPQLGKSATPASMEPVATIDSPPDGIQLLTTAEHMRGLQGSAVDTLTGVVSECTSAQRGAVAGGLKLLLDKAPGYYDWVTSVIRRIALLEQIGPDTLQSCTFDWHLGTCAITASLRPISIAEMLVHESSHQYFNQVHLSEPLVNPAHDGMYYSPFKRRDRPLVRILVAYHAFANVLLFYQTATGGLPSSQWDMAASVSAAERTLVDQQDWLTPSGRALFLPLLQRRAELPSERWNYGPTVSAGALN
jgi:HEXXH motif-containing protein